MAKGNAAVLVGPARRLKLLRLIANFAWLVSLAFIGVIANIFHFSPSLLPLGPIGGAAIIIVGVAMVTAGFISSASFNHGVARCPHCGDRFLGARSLPYALWIPRKCQHCGYDVVTGKL